MPYYNFKKQFAHLVELGRKPHTIRPRRRRPTRTGDKLYLYTGMRTAACRLLRIERCYATSPITISEEGIVCNGLAMPPRDRERFARFDGFSNWSQMREFFRSQYGLPTRNLELICWKPSPVAVLQGVIEKLIATIAED
jgi:hypothetical protein